MDCIDPTIANAGLTSLPLLLLGGLFVLALITYVLRAWEWVTSTIAAIVTGWLALWFWTLDLATDPVQLPFLGQLDPAECATRLNFVLQLQPDAIPIMATGLTLTCLAFILTIRISQGHSFVPFTLFLLTGYAFIAMLVSGPIDVPLLTPLLLVGLACISIYVLQAGRATKPNGPLRTLIPPLLTFPLFLIASWYTEQLTLSPRDPEFTGALAALLTIGLLLLLTPVPLHSALVDTAETAPPVVTMLLTLLYQLALLHLFYRISVAYPFLASTGSFSFGLTLAGLLTAVWAGVAAAGTEHPGRLWGYAALHDWGLIIMILGVPGAISWQTALLLFALRSVSMFTAAIGLAALEHASHTFDPEWLQGIGKRMPWNSAAFLIGGLGLAGFPLSAGFTGHWVALQTVALDDWRIAAVVILASAGVVFGFIRMARTLFGPLNQTSIFNEQPMGALIAVAGVLLSAGLSLAPQLLEGPLQSAFTAFGG